ncbi:type II secretion system protein GspD [Aeromonas veronii]|nr:type II secretion system protein GspD [Aeromonas veronii]
MRILFWMCFIRCRFLIVTATYLWFAFSKSILCAEYSASFKNINIDEFINTVSKTLNKTIIADPSVKGRISVRSYDLLNEEQYYQFFLSVLDVYGYAAIPMDNGILKVIRSRDAKSSAIPVADNDNPGVGDEMVTRVVAIENASARELAPLLRQLNDTATGGIVVHYDPSNALLLTGRAAVVSRLVEVVRRIDKAQEQDVDIIKLKNSSSEEMTRIVSNLNKDGYNQANSQATVKVVADQRTNSVIVSGDAKARTRIVEMMRKLDEIQKSEGGTKVFYLKYGNAKDMVDILKGVGEGKLKEQASSSAPEYRDGEFIISADTLTNSLVITAPLEVMPELERVIAQLDIRRAQVLVEAMIVELSDSDSLNLGVQWAHGESSGIQFTDSGLPISNVNGTEDNGLLKFNGMAAGFFHGDWSMLATAITSNTKNDILSTPSLVIMDNEEGAFNVGQEVPRKGTEQSSTTGDSIFTSVEYKTVGTKLVVTPRINEGDSVLLKIEQEVSSVAQTADGDNNSSLGPTFNSRTVKNAVLVRSGETVVLGGMLDEQTKENVSKVPVLGDIPLLGYFFRYTGTSTAKRNLMVFIKPTILRDADVYYGISNNKYSLFRAEQINAQRNKSYFTSPDRVVLPVLKESN